MDLTLDTPPPSPPQTSSLRENVPSSPDEIASPVPKSERVAEEIITTERAYVQSLVDIAKGYKEPILVYIRSCGLPVAEDDVSALFGNIEDLLTLNSDLLSELETCQNNPTRIAEAFVTRASDFSVYSAYCTNYPRAVAILTLWQHTPQITENSPKVTQFLKLCQKRLHHALPLGAFLIKPVQRILKYHLLLRELGKCCEKENNRANSVVQLALDAMAAIADHTNTMKRRHEAAVYIQEIQSQLTGWEDDDLSSYGDLLLEESFRVKGARSGRRVFLFRRLLLLVKKKGEHLQYKGSIPIDTVTVGDVIKASSLSFVVTELSNQDNSFELEARTDEIKSNWTSTIKQLMLDAHSPPTQEPSTETVSPLGDSDINVLNRNSVTPPPEGHRVKRGSQLGRRNAMKGSKKTVGAARGGQVSSINIQMDSPIEGNTISSNDDGSEIQAIVNVKARKSSSSSRDSTPKRTKLTINTRGKDIEYNFPSHEEPRDDEDLEDEHESLDPFDMGSDEQGENGSWPSDESEHRDESMEGMAVEEIMDIQLSVGVRSETEMTLEGETLSGEDNDEETETAFQHVEDQEETETIESTKPRDHAFESSSLESAEAIEVSEDKDKDLLKDMDSVSQTKASDDDDEEITHEIEALPHVEDQEEESEIVESVEEPNEPQDDAFSSSRLKAAEGSEEEEDESPRKMETVSQTKASDDEEEITNEIEEDTREETEIIEIAKQPSENEPQDPFITSSLETAEGNEMPRDTKTIETGASDDGEEMAHEIKCVEEVLGNEDTEAPADVQTNQTGEGDSVEEQLGVEEVLASKDTEAPADVQTGDVVEEQTVKTTEVVTGNQARTQARHRRKRKSNSRSEETKEQRELETPPDDTPTAKPQGDRDSNVERRQQTCNILPFVVVLIALTLAILVAVFVKNLSFFFKAWLIFLPSAALLLMSVSELRRRL